MKTLTVHAIETRIFRAAEHLADFIIESVPKEFVRENMMLAVTSKIVSLAECRVIPRASVDKTTLVRKEADAYLGEIGHGCHLTIKHGLLIASAGIDESNSEGDDYILYPTDPERSIEMLWRKLRAVWSLNNLGVIFTDSHTTPLRRGVTGICLSHAGFHAVRNLVGRHDLFGRELRVTQMNLADGLAAAAVLMMGEGNESCPLAVIENAEVVFTEKTAAAETAIPLEEDLYFPLLRSFAGEARAKSRPPC